jgi:hypothetical protein
MEKSKYENLTDFSLFKFLKYLHKDVGDISEYEGVSSYDSTVEDVVPDSLKKFGLELDQIDIDFFWVALKLNWDNLSGYDKLDFELKKPEVSEYKIEIKFSGRDWYTEYGSQTISAYSTESAEGYTSSDNFQAFECDNWYDYETENSETEDWEINDIEKIQKNKNVSEQKIIIKKLMKENFDNVVSDYNVDELLQLRDIIEEKLKNRISII